MPMCVQDSSVCSELMNVRYFARMLGILQENAITAEMYDQPKMGLIDH